MSLGRRFGSQGLVPGGFETEVVLSAAAANQVSASGVAEQVEAERANADLQRLLWQSGRHAPPHLALLRAPSHGVLHPPSIHRRATMALAAPRDRIARQYRDGLADLFTHGLPALGAAFSLGSETADLAAVQRASLRLPSGCSDSHIVRKHGEAVARIVMTAAQAQAQEVDAGFGADFLGRDEASKLARINPGTTADLTVATLLMAGLTGGF